MVGTESQGSEGRIAEEMQDHAGSVNLRHLPCGTRASILPAAGGQRGDLPATTSLAALSAAGLVLSVVRGALGLGTRENRAWGHCNFPWPRKLFTSRWPE